MSSSLLTGFFLSAPKCCYCGTVAKQQDTESNDSILNWNYFFSCIKKFSNFNYNLISLK